MMRCNYLTKIYTQDQLKKKLKTLRFRKIVFTNGCFDLLHKGHVRYLEKARNLGSHLVVALNSDHSVRELKGHKRPLNILKDRLEVIAALEAVDFVTW
ncbi:MAG: adenylyltransferase/cytidyltransferase family protein, partial [Bdellovibrio sp.]|nr:adenylyltransferase/cytidyltransferase family protein [Bdellovibrio sp.]